MTDFKAGNHHIISIHEMHIENVKIGIYPQEKTRPQKIILDVDLYRNAGAFTGSNVDECINYEGIVQYLSKLPEQAHMDLLETLIEQIISFCMQDQKISACRVRIKKPEAFNGNPVPSVTFFRQR